MSKFALIVLANFLLISIVVGGDISHIARSPLKKPDRPVALTPNQICARQGHIRACQTTPSNFCSQLKCWTSQRTVVDAPQAPDGMWCGPFQACISGACQVQYTMREPTTDLQFVNCDRHRS